MAYHRLLMAGYTKVALADIIGVRKQAISRWTTVPLKYVRTISEATGIPKEDLRPSDYT